MPHPRIASLLTQLKRGQRFQTPQPHGSADAWLLAQVARERSTPLAVFCAAPDEAARLADELRFFDPALRVALFPDWETLPYDPFSPHHDLISTRLQTLYALTQQQCDVLLCPITTALAVTAPPSFVLAHTFSFGVGERVVLDKLREQWIAAGYSAVAQVVAAGEFAIRGGIIDVFPMGSALPFRLDLFDDVIESIKTFDVDSQRSLYPVPSVRLLPGREYPRDEASRGVFRRAWRETFEGDASRQLMYKDMANGIYHAGIEYYLPLFFEGRSSLLDYVSADTLVVLHGAISERIHEFWRDTQTRYRFLHADGERAVLPPERLFSNESEWFSALKPFAQLAFKPEPCPLSTAAPVLAHTDHLPPYAALAQLVADGVPCLLVAEGLGRMTTLIDSLNRHGLATQPLADWRAFATQAAATPILHISHTPTGLAQGFGLQSADGAPERIVLSEFELYAPTNTPRRRTRRSEATSNVDAMIASLAELSIGDPVVHLEHGVGRYQGLINMDLGDGVTEFLHLQYANETALYVPVAQLAVISRYTGSDPETAPLHTLGTDRWRKTRQKTLAQIRDTAAELLNLYARRVLRAGHAFELHLEDYEAFVADFPFDTTADQAAAIAAVTHDLVAAQPMDRLVCGDVGFGKTEVALRAAFIAAMGGKQVAILTPTTLLAEQHFQTFSDRFAKWPVRIAEVSRFNTGKQTTEVLKGLAAGTVDIVIGTHKLLSPNVQFQRLGLVIIDEEHRFGVRQKEAMKNLRAEVDILTLTATPIPRTLGMAMEGVRDLSVIATAPQKRLAIKTFVRREDKSILREAVLRELQRGGQVYFLHNEVETIAHRRDTLAELIPEARIAIAHGQMHERELEAVMRDFYHGRANVLLCTTIIETGIDVPNANTIIMHRADKFGLAQLHQLRGRVGRSHHQAYAYLLIPHEDALTTNARRRLEAICQMEELGSGFYLAMHDMEIRGAGEILGERQSGDIHEVGFSLYNDMLQAAIKALKSGKQPDLSAPLGVTTDINLHTPALLPDAYCGHINERLNLYKRLALAHTADELDDLAEEIIDRFGALPEAGVALLDTHRLRLTAQRMGILKIDASESTALIHFQTDAPIDGLSLIQLIQTDPSVKLNGQDKLKLHYAASTAAQRAEHVRRVLAQLRLTDGQTN